MSIKEIQNIFYSELKVVYSQSDIRSLMFAVLEKTLGLSKTDVALNRDSPIDGSKIAKILQVIKKLKAEMPLEYIFSEAHFYGLKLKVNREVLIPRPETEELVQKIIQEVKKDGCNILDIGTGSGCIAIALARNNKCANVYACDISEKAMKIASFNAKMNKVGITFFLQDILKPLQNHALPKFDLIVSNPPYVTKSEKKHLKANVLMYEPHTSLFVPDKSPLLFYKAIAEFAKIHLTKKGMLFFEINENLAVKLVKLLHSKGFAAIKVMDDLNGKKRFISCLLPS